jgi:hypothetical protein
LARDAEVISPIGVALALVRDVVERTVVDPSPEDVVRVRREAIERVVAAGASADLTEVVVEIDTRRNLIRATASGAMAATAQAARADVPSDERLRIVARAAHVEACGVGLAADLGALDLCVVERGRERDLYIVERSGVVRAIVRSGLFSVTTVERADAALRAVLDEATSFGDVGRALPSVQLAYGRRVADLGVLAEAAQVSALAGEELRGLDRTMPVAIMAARRSA